MTPAPFWLRFLPHILIVLAVLSGVWYLQHLGYQRAQQDRDAADAKLRIAIQQDIIASERRSAERENGRGKILGQSLDRIERQSAQGRDRIIKEMTHEIRFTDPQMGIPEPVRDAINEIISGTHCTALENGAISCKIRDVTHDDD